MKVCPICGSTYEAGVDFCFKDGAPLDSEEEVAAAAEAEAYERAGITADELDAPDAISLSNIPAVGYDEDDVVTQTLPTDLPEPDAAAQSLSGLQPLEEPIERDITGIVDPFGGHEEEAFRARLHGVDDEVPTEADADAPVAEDDEGFDEADETQVDDEDESADESADESSDDAAAAAPAPRRARPRKRPEDFGAKDDDDNKGLFLFVAVAAILVVGFIGWQLAGKGGDDASEPPATTAVRSETPAPAPEPEPETPAPHEGEDASAEAENENEGENEGENENEGEDEGENEGEAASEADGAAAAEDATPSAAEIRRRQEQRRERGEGRRRRAEERARREAAAAESAGTSESPGSPEPPFSSEGGTGDAVAAADNPWTSPSPTPAPAADPTPAPGGSPWGATTTSEAQVTISSNPAGARVTVGGRYRGQAPVAVKLAAGTHEVRVEQSGHATQTRYVKVTGSEAVNVDVVLEPLARVAQGTVMVASSPPAMLYVDGVAKGRTPISVAIVAGPHTFRLDAEGKPSFEQTLNIELADGETVNRFFQLPD